MFSNEYGELIFHFKMLPVICFNLDKSKILPSGNGLIGKELSPLFKEQCSYFNPLPDDKILDWSKLKPIADYILSAFNPFPNWRSLQTTVSD